MPVSSDRYPITPAARTYAELDDEAAPVAAAPAELEERALLGRGGLGEVVEFFDPGLRRPVALKRPLDGAPAASAALLREAQITAQLTHPAVPAVHTVGTDEDGRPYFTMTRLTGRTLADALHDGLDRSVAGRVRVLVQVAEAVTYAHHRGVLHCDLKPANVFLGAFGEVTVMDWGIARLREDPDDPLSVRTSVPSSGAAGRFAGSVQYASPEQLRGDADLDERTDVYSLGALLHALVTGQPPVDGPSAEAIRARVLEQQVPDPEGSGVPAPLAAVIRRAMAHDRGDRYPDVASLARDLEAFLDSRAISAYAETHAAALGRWYHGQMREVSRAEADLLIATGGGLGGFLVSLALTLRPHEPAVWVVAGGAFYLAVGAYTAWKTTILWHASETRQVRGPVVAFLGSVAVAVLATMAWALARLLG